MKKSIYIYTDGQLNQKDRTLQFTTYENEKKDIPIELISDIYIMSNMTLNTTMLNLISQYGIILHFFNYYHFYTGSFYPKENLVSGELLVKQVETYTNPDKRLFLAKRFVTGAADNIYRNMRYYNSRGKNLQSAMNEISSFRNQIEQMETIPALMGIEGNIHKIYYSSFPAIINQEIEFERRVKRPPDNVVNTLVSFVNSLIYTRVLSEIYRTQLNPCISYLHEPGTRRFSLSLDLAEIFKPLIGDRMIFSLLNRKQITENSFTKDMNYLHLKKEASQLIIAEFDERLKKTIRHRDLSKNTSYQYLIRLECYKLIKHLIEEKSYDPFVIWW
ncbi:MAG: type I-B CRISPR-associated endonuclease Cas1 [Clostridiales bacterium]|jgi:CRISPR-associated endonuclease cas1, HMARI/TNEAP subtype|nr:type I-B CRISPR-associated endonuclease Cas1 [Clostridiales bacterium]